MWSVDCNIVMLYMRRNSHVLIGLNEASERKNLRLSRQVGRICDNFQILLPFFILFFFS